MSCLTEPSPLQLYQQAIDSQGFVSDTAQLQAAAELQLCFEALQRGETPKGVYLWGPVGRGKTWLMDQFHACLQVPARRQHFHHFMRWVHQRLFQLNGTAEPLQALALSLAEEIRVLCFDELFVNDIGDAIILGGLFQVLFEAGVVIVATSNQPPDQLYSDGFNRERFLPAIAAIEQHMQVIAVAGDQDHRLHPGAGQQRYWVRDDGQPTALEQVFEQLRGEQAATDQALSIGSRRLTVVQRCASVLWCRYADLCEQPFAAMDFMALCDSFQAILLGDVPALGARQRRRRLPAAPKMVPSGSWPATVSCRSCRFTMTACGASSPWSMNATTVGSPCTWKPKCPWKHSTLKGIWSSRSGAP